MEIIENSQTEQNRLDKKFLILIFILGLVLSFGAGMRGLNESDEGRYGSMAWEIVQGHATAWEPQLSGYAHYDKPPMIYWLTSVSIRCLGKNEWAVRMPCQLGAALTLLGLGWAAWRRYGRDVAWFAVLICGTLGQFWALARILTPDMILAGWCSLAIAAWTECRHRNGHWGFWLLSLLFWVLAWWTKATPALIPLIALAIGLRITGDLAGSRALRVWLMLPAMILLGAPWYVDMLLRHPDLYQFFFVREAIGRMTGHMAGRRGPPYYHVAVSLAGYLPWWPWVISGAWQALRERTRTSWKLALTALGWDGWIVLIGFLIFSAASSKLPAYTLPLAPWSSLVMARGLWRICRHRPQPWRHPALVVTGVFYVVALGLGMLLYPRYEASLGQNSSMRTIADALKVHGAQSVVLDSHFPGMEFYFGERVFYVGRPDQQRSDDAGIAPGLGERRVWTLEEWPDKFNHRSGRGWWLVHFERRRRSPFINFVKTANVAQSIQVGNFSLYQIADAAP
jgi:4-amino-4-deoxy-L-arabinose transferase-like glycosyltransferase